MPYSLNKWPEPPEVVSDAQRAGIEEVITKFDEEATACEQRAERALRYIFMILSALVLVFLFSNILFEYARYRSSEINAPALQRQFEHLYLNIDTLKKEEAEIIRERSDFYFSNVPVLDSSAILALDTTKYRHEYDSLKEVKSKLNKEFIQTPPGRELDSLYYILNALKAQPANRYYDSLRLLRRSFWTGQRIRAIERQIKAKEEDAAKISEKLAQTDNKQDAFEYVNEISIRVGIGVILIFMVQFLLRIHRYNKKLADYYAARANALRLHLTGLKDMNYHKIVGTISPDAVDLRFVKAPTDKVLDVIKSAFESGGKMMGK